MNVKEKLNQLNSLTEKLDNYFNGMIYEKISDYTDEYWTLYGESIDPSEDKFSRAESVGWSEESPLENNYEEHVYGEDVECVVRKEDFTLVRIKSSTGDGCEDLIFDNSKEINL